MKLVLAVATGQRFGRGVVTDAEIRVGPRSLRGAAMHCDCGNDYAVPVYDLLNGRTRSCGCLMRENSLNAMKVAHAVNTRHGLWRHSLYPTWHNMIERCENPATDGYPRYGGRGIRVCAEWHDVSTYIADIEGELGPKPEGMSLDRINNDGDYCPGNMRWATNAEQGQNQRSTRLNLAVVREIRVRWAAGGITQSALGAEYGVGQARISAIVNNKTWAGDTEVTETLSTSEAAAILGVCTKTVARWDGIGKLKPEPRAKRQLRRYRRDVIEALLAEVSEDMALAVVPTQA